MASSATHWGAAAAAEAVGDVLRQRRKALFCAATLLAVEAADHRHHTAAAAAATTENALNPCRGLTPPSPSSCWSTTRLPNERRVRQQQGSRVSTHVSAVVRREPADSCRRARLQHVPREEPQQLQQPEARLQLCSKLSGRGDRNTREGVSFPPADAASNQQQRRVRSDTDAFHCSRRVWKNSSVHLLPLLQHRRRIPALCADSDKRDTSSPSSAPADSPHFTVSSVLRSVIQDARLGGGSSTTAASAAQPAVPPPPPIFFPVGAGSVPELRDAHSQEKGELLPGVAGLDPQLLSFLLASPPPSAASGSASGAGDPQVPQQPSDNAGAAAAVRKERKRQGLEAEPFAFLPPDLVLPLCSDTGSRSRSGSSCRRNVGHAEAGSSRDRGSRRDSQGGGACSNCKVFLLQYERCPFCRKVRACLDLLGIAYTVVEVNPLSKKELRPFCYHKVPLFVIVRDPPPSKDNSSRDTSTTGSNIGQGSNTAAAAGATAARKTTNVEPAENRSTAEATGVAANVAAAGETQEKRLTDVSQHVEEHGQRVLQDAAAAQWLARLVAEQQQQQGTASQHSLRQQDLEDEGQRSQPRILTLHDSKAIVHALVEHQRRRRDMEGRAHEAARRRKQGENAAAAAAEHERRRREVEWLAWTDQVLVQLIVINVYRTLQEALETFSYLLTHPLFSCFQKEAARWTGSIVMRLVAARRQKEHHVVNPRQALADALEQFRCSFEEPPHAASPTPFFGGQQPGEADIAVYGILQSARDCTVDREVIQHSKLQGWMVRMQKAVGRSCALNGSECVHVTPSSQG